MKKMIIEMTISQAELIVLELIKHGRWFEFNPVGNNQCYLLIKADDKHAERIIDELL